GDNFQADCGDLRFTKIDGTQLDYYIESGCGGASTIVHVKFDMLQTGDQTIYFYYGNPSADNGFIGTDFSTPASDYSIGTIQDEEIGTGPVLWLKFDEGYGAFAYNSTDNNAGKLPGTQLDATHPLADGLVGLWLMNEGTGDEVADLSGINNLSITEAVWNSAKFGSGLYFDGEDDYLITGSQALRGYYSGRTTITLGVWVRYTESVTYSVPIGWFWSETCCINISSGKPQFRIGVGGTKAATSPDAYKDDKWHFLVATYDGGLPNANIKIYVDGILKDTTDAPGVIDSASDYFAIGVANGNSTGSSNSYGYEGYIDNAFVSANALSATEIEQLYAEPFAMVSDATRASRITEASWTDSGKFDKALDFDGDNDVVTVVPVNGDVDLQGKDAYSISTWIYPHSDGESDGEIIDKGANTYIRVANEGTDGYMDLEAGLDLASGDAILSIADALRVNRWSHILL
ncbi:unnamed protein product, partial [marine sediment metagenome]